MPRIWVDAKLGGPLPLKRLIFPDKELSYIFCSFKMVSKNIYTGIGIVEVDEE